MRAQPYPFSEKSHVDLLLSAIRGYGHYYLEEILKMHGKNVRLTGVVDPATGDAPLFERLRDLRIPVFDSLASALDSLSPDLTVISSPLQFHVAQACEALNAGSYVLLDKPMAVTVQEADRLIEKDAETGSRTMVGYQWSYSKAIQAMKRDLLSGRYGRPLRMKALCLWPRGPDYYQRNDWAGRIRDGHGRWILDSPLGNAMAHFLHNMLYCLGSEVNRSAEPVSLCAEVYRANPIQNYDTAACRIMTADGAELVFYASHAVEKNVHPRFELQCEQGTIRLAGPGTPVTAVLPSGETVDYGHPDDSPQFQKLHDAVSFSGGMGEIVCGAAACRAHTLCMNGVQELCGRITEFAPRSICRSQDGLRWVKGLSQTMTASYEKWKLPSENGAEWAVPAQEVDLRNYAYFPGGRKPE